MSLLGRLQKGSTQDEEPSGEGKRGGLTGLLGRSEAQAIPDRQTQLGERRRELKRRIQARLLEELRPPARKPRAQERSKPQTSPKDREAPREPRKLQLESEAALRQRIQTLFDQILAEEQILLTRPERRQLLDEVIADILGFGPLEPLLADEATSDILVIGPHKVYVDRGGRLYPTTIQFDDTAHLMHIIERILSPLGRRVDESSPMVDARLPDGSRVHVIIPPVALDGPCLTIRKFATIPYVTEDLIRFGTLTPQLVEFLRAAVAARLNILVSGGSSSGKTTLLNVLSSFIGADERIVTIESAAELQLQQPHLVRLETRPANIEGEGQLTVRDLMINALRMRPDRIIVGEVRGGEALDLLQAMNTGVEGSMGTIHANSPHDAISRLEVMCMMAGMNLPIRALREQIAAAVDLIVQMQRLRDGSRKVTEICEVEGLEGDSVMLSTLFEWEQRGLDTEGRAIGEIRPTGLVPRAIEQIENAGIHLPPAVFGVGALPTERRPRKEFRAAPDAEPSLRPPSDADFPPLDEKPLTPGGDEPPPTLPAGGGEQGSEG